MSLTCSESNETKYSQIPFIKEASYNKNVVSTNKNKRNWSVFKLKVLAYVVFTKNVTESKPNTNGIMFI